MSGEKFNLDDEGAILKINSPRSCVGGPYVVVYKDTAERWVIVALDWYQKPRLGIRWFWGGGGNPFSSANPTWLVIPSELTYSVLNGLTISFDFRKRLEKFLSGDIKGQDIKPREG